MSGNRPPRARTLGSFTRLPLGALLGPIVVFTVLGAVGTALTPPLAARHPLLLIAMEARDRNLLLARHVGVAVFLVVGSLRRLISDPFFYLLGRYHGRVGVAWLQRHGGGRVVAATVRAFRRAAYPMLVVFPGAVVCTLAGDAGVPPGAFGVIVVLRTIAVVLMIRFVGDVFAGPVDATIHFFDQHLVATSLASVALMGGWVLWERRSGEASADLDLR
jgi:hypothetical protein